MESREFHKQGFHPTLKTSNFVVYFSKLGKYHEFAQKVGESWNFNSKPGKTCTFSVSRFTFQDVIYKYISITSLLYVHYQNTNRVIRNGISLLLLGNNLENMWKLKSPEK